MNAAELKELCQAHYNHDDNTPYGWGWQSRLARETGISLRQIAKYASGETVIPESRANHIRLLTGAGEVREVGRWVGT